MNVPALPPVVQANRGLGVGFWLAMATSLILTVVAATAEGAAGLLMGVITLTVMGSVRFVMPRLEFNLRQGLIRSRRGSVPFSAVARVEMRSHHRGAGTWLYLKGDGGQTLGTMAIHSTLCAPPDVQQWAALRHVLHSSAVTRGAGTYRPWHQLPIDEVLRVLDAQVAWCKDGNKPSSSSAPYNELLGKTAELY